mgnify:FL=1
MKIHVLTILINMFKEWSIVGRTVDKGILSLEAIDIRDFTKDKHRQVDDYPFGGGPGMIMKAQPIYDALTSVKEKNSKTIYLSPQGKPYNQEMAKILSQEEHLILLCGHYEGIDNRIVDNYIDMEISIGDYVLTGGEVPAMVLIESIIRLLPGALANEESYSDESHYSGLLEYPQYTRPRAFNSFEVPEVLLSGNHKKIEEWEKYKSIETTYSKRPDLLIEESLSSKEKKVLEEIKVKGKNKTS